MSLTYKDIITHLREKGFYLIAHLVVIHHLRKDFIDYVVTRDRYYILPVGKDYLHVAVLEIDNGREGSELQVRYTCAGDDLLYGLRTKFNSGGSPDPQTDLDNIERLLAAGNLRGQPRYVRKRFRHGRFQAKLRALIIYLTDKWRSLIPSRTKN